MSAFMCNDDLFQTIADHLCRDLDKHRQETLVERIMSKCRDTLHPGNNPTDWAEHMIQGWVEANANAVRGRYGASAQEMIGDLPTIRCQFKPQRVSLPVLYKLIECLSYQCHEDVPHTLKEEHEHRLAEMEAALYFVSQIVISSTPEYNAAGWGRVA